MTEITKHDRFYISTVTFRVEDCLFRVPREPFEAESSVFRDMFSLPVGDGGAEGLSDAKPIQLEAVTKDDFEQLLKLLFHRPHGQAQHLPRSTEQWTSVLKLSTLWGFSKLRQRAINALEGIPISSVDKVVLAKTYGVTEWLLPAMNELAQRPEPINMEDANRLGFETALKLASVREHIALRAVDGIVWCQPYNRSHPYVDHELVIGSRDPIVQKLDFTQVLRATFNLTDSADSQQA